MNIFLVATLLLTVFARPHSTHGDDELARSKRDLIYWNRMYNSLQTTPSMDRRVAPTVICQTMRHLLNRTQTRQGQHKLRIKMSRSGCQV